MGRTDEYRHVERFAREQTHGLCPTCRGNGTVKIPGGISVCDHCQGKGWAVSDAEEHAKMRVSLSFYLSDDNRVVEFDSVLAVAIQPYVFNGELRARKALIVTSGAVGNPGTAYPLSQVADLRLAVHTNDVQD